MGHAQGTITDTPGVAGKPGKFGRRRPGIAAPLGGFKTTDFKYNAMGIGKGMLVGPLDRDALGGPGNGLTALTAKNIFLFLGLLFRRFFFGQLRCAATVFFGRTFPKQRCMNDLCGFHFTGSRGRVIPFYQITPVKQAADYLKSDFLRTALL